ncbi:MAG: tetratricopeptide repeat protein [bacterium]|nr:tetratricopeptide repeat protein [bacterium]
MNPLIIRHIPETDPPEFRVEELSGYAGGKQTPATGLPTPYKFPIPGIPNMTLIKGLQWYLEKFLEYPYHPDTDRAEYVQAALKEWGIQIFDALFDNMDGATMYQRAVKDGVDKLYLLISSDDPGVLSWPWEALEHKTMGTLAHTCQVERRLNKIEDAAPLSDKLPTDCINILMITARLHELDVGYRTMSRPLVELIKDENLPVNLTILRPPTFDRLREHLREKPNHYHIVHFDCHGGYGPVGVSGNKQGVLVFEDLNGKEDFVEAHKISVLLREHAIPVVVLNACQSAMIDEDGKDPFAMVAASLLKAGIRSVTAMAYILYVSGARVFLPEFYRLLFATGNMARAMRAGRQHMLLHDKRICIRGEFSLRDWLVPVLYQQEPVDLSFIEKKNNKLEGKLFIEQGNKDILLDDIPANDTPYGFIGRDSAILKLERAIRLPKPAIVLHGLGGVGKTTLALGFLQWLSDTQGLENSPFWFSFQEIRSAEYIFNRIGERLFEPAFSTLPVKEKIDHLANALKQYPFLIVWDNFEVVKGIEGTGQTVFSDEDNEYLLYFLKKLHGGKSKVLITSRAVEDWLGIDQCCKVSLGGFHSEEQWEYCESLVQGLGIKVDREDEKLSSLMDMLGGHPLSMRVILPMLESRSAGSILSTIKERLPVSKDKNKANAHLYAILRFVQDDMPEELEPLLIPLAFYEGFVDVYTFQDIAGQVDGEWTEENILRFFRILGFAGLVHEYRSGDVVYQMHPVLTGFLRNIVIDNISEDIHDQWGRVFVDNFSSLIDALTSKEHHEQKPLFYIHGANFYYALSVARQLNMDSDISALLQSLAEFSRKSRNFTEAEKLFLRYAEVKKAANDLEEEAAAWHQLGIIAQEQRNFDNAEKWYLKAMEIFEKQGNEHRAAMTYHQLGTIAQQQRDFDNAEKWYRKALEIEKKQGNEHGAASTYHNLGIIAQEQRDFDNAEKWYRKALELSEKLENEHGAANTYHQLGTTAQQQRDFDNAEKWYRKALEIFEKQGNEHQAAMTYHQLGMIAEDQRDFDNAEKWYRKSLEISEKLENEHGAASTYAQLGNLAGLQKKFEEAGQWLIKALIMFINCNNMHSAQIVVCNFMVFYNQVSQETQSNLKAQWEEKLGEFTESESPPGIIKKLLLFLRRLFRRRSIPK